MSSKLICLAFLVQISFNCAYVSIQDPSDYVDLSKDTLDNAIKADYSPAPVSYLPSPLKTEYLFNGSQTYMSLKQQTYSSSANDTSVLIIANGAQLNLSYSNIFKTGYSSNLILASFFGMNAAINVQNGSRSYFDHLNITTHNGAANIYSYGNNSYVYIENSVLYSSGPTAHGLYAGGYGTAVGKNIGHYSGGNRCSSFAGDSPAGYVMIENAVAHTSGIGSAIFYALGTIDATNVYGYAENSPILFSDGPQVSTLKNCDLTAGLLAGTILFSSMVRRTGAYLTIMDSKITTLGSTMPALWFGNIIATVYLQNTRISTKSGILVVSNYSQVTQEFNYFAGYADNSNLSPASANIFVSQCNFEGDLVAYNKSNITWALYEYSTWTGKAYSGYDDSYISVYLDTTSKWYLTGNTVLQNLTTLNNNVSVIYSNGFNVTYDSASPANSWLNNATILLNGGGILMPNTGQRYTYSTSLSPTANTTITTTITSSSNYHLHFLQIELVFFSLICLFSF